MRRRAGLAGGLLVALVLAAYLPALSAGYVWDDDQHVTRNPALTDARGLAAIWTTLDATPQYYPLTHTTFWIEHALWGLDPRGYHAVNVLLHAAGALLLWRVLLLLEVPGAWLAAAVFAVHPIQVESVAWVTERKNVLSGVLYFASAHVFLGWALDRKKGPLRPWIASALFVGALLSKTVTSTLPLALGVTLWWKRGRVTRRELAWLLPMLAVGAAFGAVTHHLERTQIGAAGFEWALSIPARVALAGRIVWFYLGKLAWPSELVFIYPRWTIDATSPAAWAACAAALAAGAAAWSARARIGRGVFAAFAFYVITLAPALGFFAVYPMRYSWVADHFQYLAGVGPITLAAAAASTAAARFGSARRRSHAAPVGAAIVLAVLAGRSFVRCGAYANEETLWRDTLARNPSAWIAHNNLGILLAERGASAGAAEHFERVLALKPDHTGAMANLGYLRELEGRDAEAAATLARAAAARPDDANARAHLVRVLIRLGRADEALGPALEAARLAPSDPEILCDAGTLLARAGRPAEAIPLLERALAARPDFPRARANLDLARRAAADVRYPRPPVTTEENAR